jgi:hypothetical protein
MVRRGPRWLVVGSERFAWSIGHAHESGDEHLALRRWIGCRDLVRLRREGARGRLVVVFREGNGHLVADPLMHGGEVRHADGRGLNLNQPGVVRALLDEALSRGWQADVPGRSEIDGWLLFDAVVARRAHIVSARHRS